LPFGKFYIPLRLPPLQAQYNNKEKNLSKFETSGVYIHPPVSNLLSIYLSVGSSGNARIQKMKVDRLMRNRLCDQFSAKF
jgi:hypothetical protein